MTHDANTLLFNAGVLAGAGIAILAHRIPDFIATVRHIANHFRH